MTATALQQKRIAFVLLQLVRTALPFAQDGQESCRMFYSKRLESESVLDALHTGEHRKAIPENWPVDEPLFTHCKLERLEVGAQCCHLTRKAFALLGVHVHGKRSLNYGCARINGGNHNVHALLFGTQLRNEFDQWAEGLVSDHPRFSLHSRSLLML